MLDINIWKHSFATQKGSISGPFFSSMADNENIGHVNLVITATGSKQRRENIKQKYTNLPLVEIKTLAPKKIEKIVSFGNNFQQNDFVRNEFAAIKKSALSYTHSFWPKETPSFSQHLKCMFQRKKGLVPEFHTLVEDMLAESKEINIEGVMRSPKIEHLHLTKINYQKKMQLFKKIDKKINIKENRHKTNFAILNAELTELLQEEKQVKQQKEDLLAKIAEYQNTIGAMIKNKIDLGEAANLKIVLITAFQNLTNELKEELKELNLKLDEKSLEILICQADLIAIKELSDKLQTKKENLQSQMKQLNFEYQQYCLTEGKNPDFTISFPTTSDHQPFHLNENAMLAKMQEQVQNSTYNLFNHNCAHAAKACILAGISKEMKSKIKQLGAKDDFFKLKFETPLSIYQWATQLQKYITTLNAEFLPAKSKLIRI